MSEGLGLIVEDRDIETINSLTQVPAAFCASTDDLPDEWIPDLYVEDQLRTSSCAGHAEALLCSHSNFVQTSQVVRFSRKFAYLTAQSEGGYSGRDAGTSISSTLIAATKYGCCTEATFPLDWDGPEDYSSRWTSEAQREAALHRHHGNTAFDLRSWTSMLAWITDKRSAIIGTTWYSGQDSMGWVEDVRSAFSGQYRGLHARAVIGWSKVNGVLCPVVQNSHSKSHGRNGRTVVMPDVWERWCRDPSFCCLGFNEVDEIEPARRSWLTSTAGDTC
jgi:hypothetical protein